MLQQEVGFQSCNSTLVERRLAKRFPAYLEGVCQAVTTSESESWPMRIRDISTSGICFLCNQSFERGTILKLDGKQATFHRLGTVYASVIYANQQENGEWRMGCVLDRPLRDAEVRPVVQEILTRRLNEKE
jgi:hypothetical protein